MTVKIFNVEFNNIKINRNNTGGGTGGGTGGNVSFDPNTLFSSGEQGIWYDPSDLSSLFVDIAGTVPVTSHGDPVGMMMDKSGNGHHAVAYSSARRPVYHTDGNLHWLQSPASSYMTIPSNPLLDEASARYMQYYVAAHLTDDTGRLFGDNCQVYRAGPRFRMNLRPTGAEAHTQLYMDQPNVGYVYNTSNTTSSVGILNVAPAESDPYFRYPRYILQMFALNDDYLPFQGKFYSFIVAYHDIGDQRPALENYMLNKIGDTLA